LGSTYYGRFAPNIQNSKIAVVSGFLLGGMNQAAKMLGAPVTLDKNTAADLLLPVVHDLL
jgi:hypothetical protein